MTTAAIDIDTLNELLDNQQKLDDIFSTAFDDDDFLTCSMASTKHGSGESSLAVQQGKRAGATILVQESKSKVYLVMPVLLEIATIYYCIVNFS
ncbi:MAG: hypothetical protein methR_P0831 [Methyloprofundus sp.]|nr:MAG: hypothetical protein methR_P0831 [Methyloprofundus sp.]